MDRKSRVIARDNLEAYPHTWTKGLDYELIEGGGYIKIASNEGHLNYVNEIKEDVLVNFDRLCKEKSCYDCRYYLTRECVCMKLYRTICIRDEWETAEKCKDFVEGNYDEELIEKEYWERCLSERN